MPTGILHVGLQNPEKTILEKLLHVDFIDFIRNPNQRFAEGLGNRICGSLGLIKLDQVPERIDVMASWPDGAFRRNGISAAKPFLLDGCGQCQSVVGHFREVPQGWLRSHFHINDMDFVFRHSPIADQRRTSTTWTYPKDVRAHSYLVETEIVVCLLKTGSNVCGNREFRLDNCLGWFLLPEDVKKVLDLLEGLPSQKIIDLVLEKEHNFPII